MTELYLDRRYCVELLIVLVFIGRTASKESMLFDFRNETHLATFLTSSLFELRLVLDRSRVNRSLALAFVPQARTHEELLVSQQLALHRTHSYVLYPHRRGTDPA